MYLPYVNGGHYRAPLVYALKRFEISTCLPRSQGSCRACGEVHTPAQESPNQVDRIEIGLVASLSRSLCRATSPRKRAWLGCNFIRQEFSSDHATPEPLPASPHKLVFVARKYLRLVRLSPIGTFAGDIFRFCVSDTLPLASLSDVVAYARWSTSTAVVSVSFMGPARALDLIDSLASLSQRFLKVPSFKYMMDSSAYGIAHTCAESTPSLFSFHAKNGRRNGPTIFHRALAASLRHDTGPVAT